MASFNNIHTLKAKGEASGTSRLLLAQLPWNNHAQKPPLWDYFTSKKNMAGAFFLAQGTSYSSYPTNFITENDDYKPDAYCTIHAQGVVLLRNSKSKTEARKM